MSDQDPDGDERLAVIERRISAMQGRQNQDEKKKDDRGLPVGIGAIMGRVATELVAGVIVGAFIGWMLDNWLGTSPLFLVLLFFLGAMAGMLNVWRMFSGRGLAVGYFDEHRDSSEKEGRTDLKMASQGMHSPVEQFEIKPLIELSAGGFDISFTNSSLFMLLAILVSGIFLVTAMRRGELVPGRMQGAAEMMYEFVADMVRSNVGSEGRAYFPFIFTLFVFLLFGNMLGLIPYSYTFTSQIVVTFFMAAFVFVGVTLIALFKHGLHFFSFFVPAGAPKVLIPFLIVIEVISYFVRPVSLSVRLFANMLAGHTMLKVFAGLAVMISGAGGLAMAGSLLPFLALIGLTGLEVLVAALQAYVFTILTCMYLNDALHLH